MSVNPIGRNPSYSRPMNTQNTRTAVIETHKATYKNRLTKASRYFFFVPDTPLSNS